MKKIMKKNVKGFTLVEVIVVLVILAAMAALLVPSLVGYVDKANENTALQEAGSAVKATQTLTSEYYAKKRAIPTVSDTGDVKLADAEALAEVGGTITMVVIGAGTEATGGTSCRGKIYQLMYTTAGGNIVYYTNDDGLSPLYQNVGTAPAGSEPTTHTWA